MTILEYEVFVRSMSKYPHGIVYAALALNGEAGELANEQKKVLRDDHGEITPERREKMLLELGDILWYVTACALELRSDLHEVMTRNVDKLRERHFGGEDGPKRLQEMPTV